MDYTVAQTHKRKASVDAGTGPAPKRHALATELTRTPVDATASHPLQRTKIDLVGFMRCSELRDLVTYSLNARDFVSLRDTCKEFRGLAQNINTRLRRFVSRLVEFRSLQAESEALLTGGFALSFIEGQTENMSDLKVHAYVHITQSHGMDPDFRPNLVVLDRSAAGLPVTRVAERTRAQTERLRIFLAHCCRKRVAADKFGFVRKSAEHWQI